MVYKCGICKSSYSGNNIPKSLYCKYCGVRLEKIATVTVVENTVQTEKNNSTTEIVTDVTSHSNENINTVNIEDETNDWLDSTVDVETSVETQPVYETETSIYEEDFGTEVATVENAEIAKVQSTTVVRDAEQIVYGEIIVARMSIVEGRERRNVLQKASDSLKYKQSMSDAYNEVDIMLDSDERCTVMFYGDTTFGVESFERNSTLKAYGEYISAHEFWARELYVNGRLVVLKNRNLSRRQAQEGTDRGTRTQRTATFRFWGLIILLAAFLVLAGIKVSRVGLDSFILMAVLILVGIRYVIGWVISRIFARTPQEIVPRTRRATLIVAIVLLVIWVLR